VPHAFTVGYDLFRQRPYTPWSGPPKTSDHPTRPSLPTAARCQHQHGVIGRRVPSIEIRLKLASTGTVRRNPPECWARRRVGEEIHQHRRVGYCRHQPWMNHPAPLQTPAIRTVFHRSQPAPAQPSAAYRWSEWPSRIAKMLHHPKPARSSPPAARHQLLCGSGTTNDSCRRRNTSCPSHPNASAAALQTCSARRDPDLAPSRSSRCPRSPRPLAPGPRCARRCLRPTAIGAALHTVRREHRRPRWQPPPRQRWRDRAFPLGLMPAFTAANAKPGVAIHHRKLLSSRSWANRLLLYQSAF